MYLNSITMVCFQWNSIPIFLTFKIITLESYLIKSIALTVCSVVFESNDVKQHRTWLFFGSDRLVIDSWTLEQVVTIVNGWEIGPLSRTNNFTSFLLNNYLIIRSFTHDWLVMFSSYPVSSTNDFAVTFHTTVQLSLKHFIVVLNRFI